MVGLLCSRMYFILWSVISSFMSTDLSEARWPALIPPQVLLRRDCWTSAAVKWQHKPKQRHGLVVKDWPFRELGPITRRLSFLPGRIIAKVKCLSLMKCQHYDQKLLKPSWGASTRAGVLPPGHCLNKTNSFLVGVNVVLDDFYIRTLKAALVFQFF